MTPVYSLATLTIMNDAGAEGALPKARGKGFPVLPLAEARDYVAEAIKYGDSHHIDAFATYLGHRQPRGGAFNNKIAAVRDWGLITRAGQTVTLTDLAKRLALPTDPAQHQQDLRAAFMACGIFREAYERNAKGQPLRPEAFGNSVVLNLGIAASAKDRFVRSFSRSAITAGLAKEDGTGALVLNPIDQSDAKATRPEPDSAGPPESTDESRGAISSSPAPPAGGAAQRPAFRQTWQFDGGQLDMTLALSTPLPREAYAHIGVSMAELIAILEEATARARAVADSEAS